jgi:hypothetical protein
MNVTQEAIDSIIKEVARVTVGWPKRRRWESTEAIKMLDSSHYLVHRVQYWLKFGIV